MATQKFLVDLVSDESVGLGTASPDSPIHIEKTDTAYDVARGLHIDYTKNHLNTSGWGASLFGIRSTVANDGIGKLTDNTAGRFEAKHVGTGISYFLLGTSSRGTHEGSGDTGVIWGAFNAGQVTGTGTGTHPYLIGTNQKADLNNANATVGIMAGIVTYAKTTAGDITNRIVGAEIGLDCNQGAATAVDAAVLYLDADVSSLTTSGTARTINSVSTLPSVFLGSIESTSFIKTGGTSAQFLKADGSIDSNVYGTPLTTEEVQDIVGGMVSGNSEDSVSVTYDDFGGKLNFAGNADKVVVFNSSFAHTTNSNLSWYNLPFNSLTESTTAGEQHFMVMPYEGRIRKIIMKNTGTGSTPAGTSSRFRVLVNGTVEYTGGGQTVTASSRRSITKTFGDNDLTFDEGQDIQVQFNSAGTWFDTVATIVIEYIQ